MTELHELINKLNYIMKEWDIAYEGNLKEFEDCLEEIDRRLKLLDHYYPELLNDPKPNAKAIILEDIGHNIKELGKSLSKALIEISTSIGALTYKIDHLVLNLITLNPNSIGDDDRQYYCTNCDKTFKQIEAGYDPRDGEPTCPICDGYDFLIELRG